MSKKRIPKFRDLEAESQALNKKYAHLPWIKRRFAGNILTTEDNESHRLGTTEFDGKSYVFPQVIERNGKLQKFKTPQEAIKYAHKNKTLLPVKDAKLANYYSRQGLIKHTDMKAQNFDFGIDFNTQQFQLGGNIMTREEQANYNLYMQQYGFGGWLQENAGTIGQVAGTIGGSFLGMPGLGGKVGGAIGGQVQGNYQENQQQELLTQQLNQTAIQDTMKKQMAAQGQYGQGGDLNDITQYNGPSHNQGGIALGNTGKEVEGEETRGIMDTKDFIFSDKIKVPGTDDTYADVSKDIDKKYEGMGNDKIATESKNRELDLLAKKQQQQKQAQFKRQVAKLQKTNPEMFQQMMQQQQQQQNQGQGQGQQMQQQNPQGLGLGPQDGRGAMQQQFELGGNLMVNPIDPPKTLNYDDYQKAKRGIDRKYNADIARYVAGELNKNLGKSGFDQDKYNAIKDKYIQDTPVDYSSIKLDEAYDENINIKGSGTDFKWGGYVDNDPINPPTAQTTQNNYNTSLNNALGITSFTNQNSNLVETNGLGKVKMNNVDAMGNTYANAASYDKYTDPNFKNRMTEGINSGSVNNNVTNKVNSTTQNIMSDMSTPNTTTPIKYNNVRQNVITSEEQDLNYLNSVQDKKRTEQEYSDWDTETVWDDTTMKKMQANYPGADFSNFKDWQDPNYIKGAFKSFFTRENYPKYVKYMENLTGGSYKETYDDHLRNVYSKTLGDLGKDGRIRKEYGKTDNASIRTYSPFENTLGTTQTRETPSGTHEDKTDVYDGSGSGLDMQQQQHDYSDVFQYDTKPFEADWVTAAASTLPNIGVGIGNAVLGKNLRYDRATAEQADPNFVDPTRPIQDVNNQYAGAKDQIKQVSGGSGNYLSNLIGATASESKAIAGIHSQYDNINAGIANEFDKWNAQQRQRTGLINTQIGMQEKQDKIGLYQNAMANVGAGINTGITNYNNSKHDANMMNIAGGENYYYERIGGVANQKPVRVTQAYGYETYKIPGKPTQYRDPYTGKTISKAKATEMRRRAKANVSTLA